MWILALIASTAFAKQPTQLVFPSGFASNAGQCSEMITANLKQGLVEIQTRELPRVAHIFEKMDQFNSQQEDLSGRIKSVFSSAALQCHRGTIYGEIPNADSDQMFSQDHISALLVNLNSVSIEIDKAVIDKSMSQYFKDSDCSGYLRGESELAKGKVKKLQAFITFLKKECSVSGALKNSIETTFEVSKGLAKEIGKRVDPFKGSR